MTAKLTASADGTKVLIGTAAEDALQIDSASKTIKPVAPYVIQDEASPQTWQNLTASRVGDSVYTNNTGRPIDVAITCTVNDGSGGAGLLVGGVSVAIIAGNFAGTNIIGTLYATVPVGATYSIPLNAGVTITYWAELR